MKFVKYAVPVILIGMLAGCAPKQQTTTSQEQSASSKAALAALSNVPKSEFDRCFKEYKRDVKFTTYIVLKRQENGRECGVAVENYPGGLQSPFARVTPFAGVSDSDNGYSVEKCEMQILRCVDPKAAKRLSTQYSLKN